MKTGERQIARLPRRRTDFREKSHKLIPGLTNVKTPLAKTTVKMETGLKLQEEARRIPARKARFREKCRFSRFSGFWRKSPIFADFRESRKNRDPGITTRLGADGSRSRNLVAFRKPGNPDPARKYTGFGNRSYTSRKYPIYDGIRRFNFPY